MSPVTGQHVARPDGFLIKHRPEYSQRQATDYWPDYEVRQGAIHHVHVWNFQSVIFGITEHPASALQKEGLSRRC